MTPFVVRVLGAGMSVAMIASAAPALDAPMNGASFDAFVTGYTVTFARDGLVYGVEQYMPGRMVVWRQQGGECKEGVWFEQGDNICFDYGEGTPLQCWQFFDSGLGLQARFATDPDGLLLYEAQRSKEPMQCPVPYIGS